jgi:predicted RND superfamily exporter protein
VKSLLRNNEVAEQRISNYISDDYTMSVVRLNILEDVDEEEVVEELREAINVKKPQGVSVEICGDPVMMVAMQELIHSTMGVTALVSIALIILILIILFASIKYGFIPLLTIVCGSVWAELQSQKREDAMVDTISNVFYPMLITTIAAVVGFKCLSLGKLPLMEDMGTMMAVGIVFCMVAALTVVPAVLVLFERKG